MTTLRKISNRVPEYPGRAVIEGALTPILGPLARAYAGKRVLHTLGFWTAVHAYGSRKAVVEAGICSRASAYNLAAEFREMYGVEVEDWQPQAAALLHPSEGGDG